MEQANKFFFLSKVNGYILADFQNKDGVTVINMRHAQDNVANRLQVRVKLVGDKFVISYDAVFNGERITQGDSDPIPASMVEGVIANIANDTIRAV